MNAWLGGFYFFVIRGLGCCPANYAGQFYLGTVWAPKNDLWLIF